MCRFMGAEKREKGDVPFDKGRDHTHNRPAGKDQLWPRANLPPDNTLATNGWQPGGTSLAQPTAWSTPSSRPSLLRRATQSTLRGLSSYEFCPWRELSHNPDRRNDCQTVLPIEGVLPCDCVSLTILLVLDGHRRRPARRGSGPHQADYAPRAAAGGNPVGQPQRHPGRGRADRAAGQGRQPGRFLLGQHPDRPEHDPLPRLAAGADGRRGRPRRPPSGRSRGTAGRQGPLGQLSAQRERPGLAGRFQPLRLGPGADQLPVGQPDQELQLPRRGRARREHAGALASTSACRTSPTRTSPRRASGPASARGSSSPSASTRPRRC